MYDSWLNGRASEWYEEDCILGFYVSTCNPSWTLDYTTPERDSNPRYIVFQSTALPLSYESYYNEI
ncbi:hypothetical protein OUZ56_031480 [Daphnia magna]|uniref:Uncharacterized protein n=1 Tax=Daphnia magna TaxID=35525 RepID=A0ABQ9ZV63_9CRUS|nr:hypothetical protein OUZ56_031480 [Daphnia magna]